MFTALLVEMAKICLSTRLFNQNFNKSKASMPVFQKLIFCVTR